MPLSVSLGRDACPSPGSFCLSSSAQYCAVENGDLIVPRAVGEPFAIERTQHRTSPRGAFDESEDDFAGTGRR